METIVYTLKEKAIEARQRLTYDYREKYFNLWLSSFKWTGINRQQREFLMRRLWAEGSAAFFTIIKPHEEFLNGLAPAKMPEADQSGLIGIAKFSVQAYNMFNFPTCVQLINTRGVPYVPTGLQVNEKDVVLMYAQHSRMPICEVVFDYINRIVDVDMTIRTNLIANKIPLLIKVNPMTEGHAIDYQKKVENDEAIIFVDSQEPSDHTNGGTGVPYIIDKLYAYKTNLENELHTFLGIDNIGNVEKKERLVSDEANANEPLTQDYSDSILSNLVEGCDLIKQVLGFNISVEPTNSPAEASPETEESDDEEDSEDNGKDPKGEEK